MLICKKEIKKPKAKYEKVMQTKEGVIKVDNHILPTFSGGLNVSLISHRHIFSGAILICQTI